MASLPLTLAALATSAVPGLEAIAVRAHHPDGGDYTAAILTTENDEVIISVPRTQQAETAQSASVLAISALTDGARSSLPFAVPRVLGVTRAGETRAVVSTYLPGFHFSVSDLTEDALLVESIAETVSAIHALPAGIVQLGGLPDRSAQDQRLRVTRLVDRAASTRKVPELILNRWTAVLEAVEIWDFAPRTVHGSLSGESLLIEDDRVIGLLDWSELSIGDPAVDLAWLFEAGPGAFEAVTSRYLSRGHSGNAQALRSRALLYHELEIAKWLLHGVETHDESIVTDAVNMLDRLVDQLNLLESPLNIQETLDEAEAIDLLGHTPVIPHRSGASASEEFDEDRMYGADTDFVEPLSAEDIDAGASSGAASSSEVDSREQLTQPISDDDLPTPRSHQ